jgi:glycosyltransferase involved in cell wall biosynthesis
MSGRGAVLLVANYVSDVGYAWWLMENYWACIAHGMAARGRTCHLAYPKIRDVPQVIRDAPVELHEVKLDETVPAANTAFDALVREVGAESVYLTDRSYTAPYYSHLRRQGVRTIVLHDHTPGERPPVGGLKGWLKAQMFRFGFRACDRYVATSEYIRQRMLSNARIDAARTVVVPNGIRATAWCEDDRAWARAELGVEEDEVVVGMVARAHRVKGIDFAIECARRLQAQGWRRVSFAFVGDGPELDNYRSQAADLGPRFRFLGRRMDARRLMRGFDIGFHPSRGEVGYCLAILEMMDASLPVVVPDITSVNGATEHGRTGLVYPPEDVAAATQAIVRLVANPEERAALGVSARSTVAKRFVLARTNEVFEREVVELL